MKQFLIMIQRLEQQLLVIKASFGWGLTSITRPIKSKRRNYAAPATIAIIDFSARSHPLPSPPDNYFGGTKGPIQVSRIQNQAPFIMSYDNNYCSGAGGTKWPMGSEGILWRRVAAPCPSEGEGVCARLGTGSAG